MLGRMTRIVLFLGLIMAVSAIAASAQARRGINARQTRQQSRISRGIDNGSLTSRETARIEGREARIDRQEARYRQSGDGLSPRERAKLERELNHTSRFIYHQKHDRQSNSPIP